MLVTAIALATYKENISGEKQAAAKENLLYTLEMPILPKGAQARNSCGW